MNEKLAKELEDAGFVKRSGAPIFIEDDFFPPTLSELIEACGLVRLSPYSIYAAGYLWTAEGGVLLSNTCCVDFYGQGHTREEAVARLWLALNKK